MNQDCCAPSGSPLSVDPHPDPCSLCACPCTLRRCGATETHTLGQGHLKSVIQFILATDQCCIHVPFCLHHYSDISGRAVFVIKRLQVQFLVGVFSSIKKTLIIPQGAILLWSWRARKKINEYIKLREQYNKHNTTNKRDLL